MATYVRPEGTGSPLVCLPFPLSRVDNSAPDARPMFEKNSVDVQGVPVGDPSQYGDKLALETNPNLMFEHWDEYWRKIHGPKFCHKEGAEDISTDLVMSYNQVHRLASGPSSLYPPPYRPPLTADGKLSSTPAAEVPPYRRPQFDGLAEICYRSISETEKFFLTDKYFNRIIPDEQIFLRVCLVFESAEYIIIPGAEVPDPIVMAKFYYRKGGTREEFQHRLLWDHADYIYGLQSTQDYVTRFALLLNLGPTDTDNALYQEAGQQVDAMSLMSFRNMTECEAYLGGQEYKDIEKVEAEFVDQEKSDWFTAINYNLVNKVGKEVATNRNLKPLE